MAKTSGAGALDSKEGRKMNVDDVEAALPVNVATPVPEISKIWNYICIAAMILLVLWFYTTLLSIVLPFAVSDSDVGEEVHLVLSSVACIMEILIKFLLFGAFVLLAGNTN